jgi:carboxymethylenebutenolidase
VTSEIAPPRFTARPAADPPWPGVVVIHEGNGMSPQLLRFCERLAREGYATVAPDLFFRSGGSEAADFATLIGALRRDEVRSDLDGAVAALRAEGATKVGITGFCMGGGIAYRAALGDVDVACAASFYGASIAQELGSPKCPVLCFFGDDDPWVPVEAINAVRAHHGDDVVVYHGAGHGFMRDGSPDFHEEAAGDAWARLLAFFGTHLRG